MSINKREYWDEIKEICSEIVESIEDRDGIEVIIHSTLVEHEYISSYSYHKYIMEYTNNENSFIDRFGEIGHVNTYLKCMAEFAFWAMYDDIYDKLEEYGIDRKDKYFDIAKERILSS